MFSIETFQRFFHQFTLLYRPFENRLNVLLSKHQIQRAQWTILYYLSYNDPPTLVEISNYLSVEKPTTTRTINRLEELGYVEQVPSKDKREKRIQLTELGKEVYKNVRITIDQFEQDILKGTSEEDQLNAIQIMKEIQNNIINWEDKK